MNALQQIPRNALAWMLLSLFTLVAPHALRLPIWVLAVYVIAAVWRVMVYRGRWSFPGRAVKFLLILSACGGVGLSYGSLVGLEPTVALLLTAFALKVLELKERKDAYVLIFLGYFVCITQFLFSQDLLVTLYSFINVLLLTTALVALHQPGEHQFNRGTIRTAGVMLLQALPLMVVLFFLFPRFGPLWTVPIKSHTAKTGMSDFMKPGDVASLSQSGEVAFRVKFDGEIPEPSQLYWRGLVFSRFEGGVWSALSPYTIPPGERRPADVDPVGDVTRYSIIMEPTQQSWLYALRYARSTTPGVMLAPDYRLYRPGILEVETRYEVRSWRETPLDLELSRWRRDTETRLPAQGNPRARALAQAMRERAGSDAQFVDDVVSRFTRENYTYTLKPGRLEGPDRIDAFLFDTLRGFCEHYASAFVFMMRAAGVPARVVAGYQGGETNPVNGTVIVHQFDAHAWAEVWLAGRGWVRVDPTAAVAPERIEWGLEQAMQGEGSFLAETPLSPLRYRNINLLNQLRLRYDALTYRWQSWVVGFNGEQQLDMLQRYLGKLDARKFAAVLLGSWALVLIPVAFVLMRRRRVRPVSPLDRAYMKFCARMARAGVRRYPGEAPAPFARRAAAQLPALAGQLAEIARLYNELAYAPAGAGQPDRDALRRFERAVADCRPRRD